MLMRFDNSKWLPGYVRLTLTDAVVPGASTVSHRLHRVLLIDGSLIRRSADCGIYDKTADGLHSNHRLLTDKTHRADIASG